jgi:2,3-bisphosphoglycerate-dependent phosphoglycerate mutase
MALIETWDGVCRIYHSPESKAVATARIISEITSIPTSVMDDLQELSIPTINSAKEFVRRVGAFSTLFPATLPNNIYCPSLKA